MDYLRVDDSELDELMNRIRHHLNESAPTTESNEFKTKSKIENEFSSYHNYNSERIDIFISEANIGRTIGLALPPMYRMKGIKRKVAVLFARIFIRFSNLITNDIRKFNNATLNILLAMKSNFDETNKRINDIHNKAIKIENENQLSNQRFQDKFSDLERIINNLENKIKSNNFEARFDYIEELISNEVTKKQSEVNKLQNEVNKQIKDIEKLFNLFGELETNTGNIINNNLINIQNSLENMGNRLNQIERDTLYKIEEKTNHNEIQIQDLLRQIIRLDSLYRTQKRLIRDSIKEMAIDEINLLNPSNKTDIFEDFLSDEFYSDFQEEFRGTREDIKHRLEVYLPLILNMDISDNKVLDLACGRGEWLELLKENGISAIGVDSNSLQVYRSLSAGLDVVEEDVISFLERTDDDSLGTITGFHIIEHLPFNVLMKMLKECYRVLRPNGMILFETPNPKNLIVGSSNFYMDPTHKNPLHPDVIKFFVERIGFNKVEIIYANKMKYVGNFLKPLASGSDGVIWDKNIDMLNELLYGYQDYSVIGWKI